MSLLKHEPSAHSPELREDDAGLARHTFHSSIDATALLCAMVTSVSRPWPLAARYTPVQWCQPRAGNGSVIIITTP